MSATKALTTNADLTQSITNAALLAMKAGMTREEVAAILTNLASTLENADD
jgi:hypothetical protein